MLYEVLFSLYISYLCYKYEIYNPRQPSFVLWLSLFQNPSLRNRFLFLYPTTFPEFNNNKIWFLSIETESHSENFKNFYSRVFLNSHVVVVVVLFCFFFWKFRCNSCNSTFLCSTCLISLLYLISSELFSKSYSLCLSWKKFAKLRGKEPWWSTFW